MGSIQILPETIASKIAAGEVIERPASVIKELVENSIDAQATEVVIEVSSSGAGVIRVTDNGCGISSEDAKLAFLLYATSKIRDLDDLWQIQTMGFRGEALPSIAAVARVTMVTKSSGDRSAARIVIEGGEVKEVSETGAPQGTMIEVRDLFYNTPVRRKFMKSEMTEFGHITHLVTQLALANPAIDFRLRRQGKPIFEIPVTHDPKERVRLLFGQEIASALIPIAGEKFSWGEVKGWLGGPALNRPNRTMEYYFVNRRGISNRSLSHAVMEGYHTLLPGKRFPVVFLFLEIDPKRVDVNVHPAKREVKFQEEARIHDDVVRSTRKTLQQKPVGAGFKPAPTEDHSRSDQVREAVEGYFSHANSLVDRSVFGITESLLEIPTVSKIRVLCQLQNTYIVAEDEKGLLVYDQHTVHERIRYERLTEQFQTAKLESQALLFPETVELTPQEEAAWEENQELFAKIGFEIEFFGSNSILVRSAPGVLNQVNLKKFLRDLLAEVIFLEKGTSQTIPDQMLKTLACRSAVMAGETLDKTQLQPLVDQLQMVKFPQSCPHGRPTTWRIAWEELAKRFQR
jgi:DNA mismatch repair protein MutL